MPFLMYQITLRIEDFNSSERNQRMSAKLKDGTNIRLLLRMCILICTIRTSDSRAHSKFESSFMHASLRLKVKGRFLKTSVLKLAIGYLIILSVSKSRREIMSHFLDVYI